MPEWINGEKQPYFLGQDDVMAQVVYSKGH